jgi:hypothetical protein
MMTPDIETHARVWKFRIERIFFRRDGIACARASKKLQRIIAARQQQDFVHLFAGLRNVLVMFKLNSCGRDIWNYRPHSD